jgi:hypothetical protein
MIIIIIKIMIIIYMDDYQYKFSDVNLLSEFENKH